MENNQLDLIAKMLRAQLMGAGHLWWVSGYIYGQTSNGDLFIILYPSAENLKAVYEKLGSRLTVEKKETEVSGLLALVAAVLALLAGGLSLLWFNRVL